MECAETKTQNSVATEDSIKKCDFAVVVFPNMPETYPVNAHIECRYIITTDFVPTKYDWVGLYKVGWISSQNYVFYNWAPMPENCDAQKEIDGRILFHSSHLPDDDGEFYQFCYVSSSGQVKGASTPFQFKKPRADDFVEMMDEENDLLVIHSKSAYLEENLKKAEESKKILIEIKEKLEKEREEMIVKVVELTESLKMEQGAKKQLLESLKASKQTLELKDKEAEDLIIVHDELRRKVEILTKQKSVIENKLDELVDKIDAFKSQIKILQNEKDEAIGKYQALEKEKELYKSQLTAQVELMQKLEQEKKSLEQQLTVIKTAASNADMELNKTLNAMHEEKCRIEEQINVATSSKKYADDLTEKLKNVENKLSASQTTKEMLQKELSAYEATLKKMSSDLEASRSESLYLKTQMSNMDEASNKVLMAGKKKLDQTKKDLDSSEKICEKLKSDVEDLREKLVKAKENMGVPQESVYHLQKAQETLTERYAKVQQKNTELRTRTEDLAKQLRSAQLQNVELLQEKVDWKLRVTQCSEEYKKLFSENRKLTKKIEKQIQPTESSPVGKEEKLLRTMEAGHTAIIEKLKCELERQRAKKSKHKTAYQEELEKREVLRKQYCQSLEKVRQDLDKCRQERDEKDEELSKCNEKIRTLEKYLMQRDSDVEDLNRRLCFMTQLREEMMAQNGNNAAAAASSSSSPVSQSVSGTSAIVSTSTIFGNPYKTVADFTAQSYPVLNDMNMQSAEKTEKLETDGSLQMPPPISPTILPSARMAAVKAILTSGDNTEDVYEFDDNTDDRYEDAFGDGMKICPLCEMTFSADYPDSDFSEHVFSHYGAICPLCKKQVDKTCPDCEFENHVHECMKRNIN